MEECKATLHKDVSMSVICFTFVMGILDKRIERFVPLGAQRLDYIGFNNVLHSILTINLILCHITICEWSEIFMSVPQREKYKF